VFVFTVGPFSFTTLIGRGGASEVWKGRHALSNTPVALKVSYTSNQQTLACTNLLDEAQRMVGLHHPGVIQIYDFGELPDDIEEHTSGLLQATRPYLIMELATTGLHQYTGQLPWALFHHIQLSVLHTLAYIHAKGIIHCDIKPGNLLISKEHSQVKLSDFGISCTQKELASRHQRHVLIGTPSYMAPEQLSQTWRDYGPWTDLYALGCTLVELLTGQPPFGHKESLDLLKKAHLFELPPPLPSFLDIPDGYEAWLQTLLAKDPADRFQSAADAIWTLSQVIPSLSSDSQPACLDSLLEEARSNSPDFDCLPTLIETQPVGTLSTTSIPPTQATLDPVDAESQHHTSQLDATIDTASFLVAPPTRPDLPHLPRTARTTPPMPSRWPQLTLRSPAAQLKALPTALRQSLDPPLLGRHGIQQQLWNALHHTREQQQSRTVVLRGPAGIGKTKLAHWLLESVHQTGAATGLYTACQTEHSPNAGLHAMTIDALRCHGLHGRALTYQISAVMSAIQPVLDPLNTNQPTRSIRLFPWEALTEWLEHTPDSQTAAHPPEAFTQFLLYLAQQRPCVLCIDQPHLSQPTLLWLERWLTQGYYAPLLLLVCLPDIDLDTLPPTTAHPIHTILSHHHTQVIDIPPLDDNAQEQLIQFWTTHPNPPSHHTPRHLLEQLRSDAYHEP
jgi:serine/threonine protein kinase